jgi:hypothetical protein
MASGATFGFEKWQRFSAKTGSKTAKWQNAMKFHQKKYIENELHTYIYIHRKEFLGFFVAFCHFGDSSSY